MQMLGIDIGGTGIKGAPVDLKKGTLAGERFRVPTPEPATPDAVAAAIGQLIQNFGWKGSFGCTFPGVVRAGQVLTAVHMHDSWVGLDAEKLLVERLGQPAVVINDADAAALAEARYGAGRAEHGLVLTVTLGTGIGTGIVYRGVLIPNAELGHLEVRGKDAERRASNAAREEKGMSWKKWSRNVSEYLGHLERLLSPDLIILGGGAVKDADMFLPRLQVKTRLVPAQLGNLAGIVGAALACASAAGPTSRRAKR